MAKLFYALAGSLLLVSLLYPAAHADSTSIVSGWTIEKFDQPHTCDATAPASEKAELSIAVLGPQFKLILSSNAFHISPGTYPVAISIDGGPKVTLNALGDDGVYAIAIVPSLGAALRSASVLTATIGTESYTFDVRHADVAMDAASRCAGMPSFLETQSHPPEAIDGASGWALVDNLPGVDRCSVRKNGDEVDTMLMRNKDGRLLLFAGRGNWAFPTGQEKINLQFDDQPPTEVDAAVFDNLIIVSAKGADLEPALTHSKRLSWRTPQGEFHSDLAGVTVALESLRICDLRKAGSPAN